jgi:NADH-quinone oxidoreductase subunit L
VILPLNLAGWLVFLVPAAGALLTPLFAKIHGNLRDVMAVFVGFLTAFLALDMLATMILSPDVYPVTPETFRWIVWGSTGIEFGVMLDPLSVLLAVIAGGIGSLIILYSVGYMTGHDKDGNLAKDPSLTRYYFFMQLFVSGMILLVVADNLLMTFIGWEIVGMCSYALIGFWHNLKDPSPVSEYKTEGEYNAACGMKAFMVTRVGDIGLLAGILLLYFLSGTFNYRELGVIAETNAWPVDPGLLTSLLPLVAILIFAGPIGKSAQFPLHIWLPEAMAGPTTVSALIHAAAMVKAGVYLIARIVPIFIWVVSYVGGIAIFFQTVAWIGAFTAFMAATMALVQDEIKKVLAYSTVSQLGYMYMVLGASGFIAEGVVAFAAATFHLLAHAIFKALLFLAAGSVLHATQTKKMSEMGGLKDDMRITRWTFMFGALSLAGVAPFVGFWSKDLIFEALWHGHEYLLFTMAFLTAILTAFYTFRMIYQTFYGEKSMHIKELEEKGHRIHESRPSMLIPLIVLAALGLIGGLFEPVFFQTFGLIGEGIFEWSHVVPWGFGFTTLLTLVAGGVGIGSAFWIYWRRGRDFSSMKDGFLYKFLWNRWYINRGIYRVFVDGYLWVSQGVKSRVESALLSASASVSRGMDYVSKGWRRTMTGVLNANVLSMMIGIIAFLAILILL